MEVDAVAADRLAEREAAAPLSAPLDVKSDCKTSPRKVDEFFTMDFHTPRPDSDVCEVVGLEVELELEV